jgi:hypothetical protein
MSINHTAQDVVHAAHLQATEHRERARHKQLKDKQIPHVRSADI